MKQLKLIIAAFFLTSPFLANATILTFDSSNHNLVDYGDRVTSTDDLVNGFFYEEGNGFTPNIVVDYAPSFGSFSVWSSGYGTLTNALGHGLYNVPGSISLIADAGWLVSLNSFDVSAYVGGPIGYLNNSSIRVFDGFDNILFDSGVFTPNPNDDFNYIFGTSLVAQTLRIELLEFGDLALDNVNFDQVSTSVPEPGTLALLGLGLAGMGWSQRKKKA